MASSRAPGETLMRAIAESDRSSVATIRVKANQLTWRGLPPTLNVYDRTGKRIYHRPFVAGGNVSPHGPADFSEMARIVCRLVRHLDVGEAHVSVYCGVRAEGGVYLEINDVKFPARQSEQSPVWVTTRRFGADSRPELTVRGQEVRLLRTSRGGCVGPLNIEGDSDIYLYSPVEQWITALRVRLAGQ